MRPSEVAPLTEEDKLNSPCFECGDRYYDCECKGKPEDWYKDCAEDMAREQHKEARAEIEWGKA